MMLNIIRRSQIVGSKVIDITTATPLCHLDDVWLDESGRVAYLSGDGGSLSPVQVAWVGDGLVCVFHRQMVKTPENLRYGYHLPVQSADGLPLGWVDDFLFDWHTGDVLAYILAGYIAIPFGNRAVLFPEDVEAIFTDTLILREGGESRLKRESEGLIEFLSEKSRQAQEMVQAMENRLHHLIAASDHPEIVHVKIKDRSQESSNTGNHDHPTFQEATEFLHHQWESLQHRIAHEGDRAKLMLDNAWKQLVGKK
jgi:uncharacterized protein YrrD